MNPTLYINVSDRRLVAGPLSNSPVAMPDQFFGSHAALDLVFLADNGDGTLAVLDWDAYAVAVGVIAPASQPIIGFFPLGFGEDATPLLRSSAFARRIEAELNLLDSIIEAGGATVVGPVGGPFKVFFNEPGERELIASENDQLFPGAKVVVDRAQEGDDDVREIQLIRFVRLPAAFEDAWTNFAEGYNANAANGKTGVISLATAGCRQIVGSATAAAAMIEVRVTPPGGDPMTVLSAPFQLVNSQLVDASAEPVELADVMTAAEVNAAIADAVATAVAGTASNPYTVATLTLTPGETYTASDLTTIIAKLNALITALTR
ncbi:MAG: hypothetical protein NTY01_03260 [Verrucomicrobia bacterium]|nr:hypothetical protein [Verrucomicrobiota bacterium]